MIDLCGGDDAVSGRHHCSNLAQASIIIIINIIF